MKLSNSQIFLYAILVMPVGLRHPGPRHVVRLIMDRGPALKQGLRTIEVQKSKIFYNLTTKQQQRHFFMMHAQTQKNQTIAIKIPETIHLAPSSMSLSLSRLLHSDE